MKLKLAAIAVAVSMIGLGTASAAQAVYSDPTVQVSVHPTTLVGGGDISGTASNGSPNCDWTVEFNGEVLNGPGPSFDFSFTTPVVDHKTVIDLNAECAYEDGNTNQSSANVTGSNQVTTAAFVLPNATQFVDRTIEITLLPKGDDDDDDDSDGSSGGLPATGGPQGILLIAGASLVVVGAGAVVVARRKGDRTA